MPCRLASGLVAACMLMTALLVSCSNDEDPAQPECNLSLQLPNGGEVWKSGQVYALRWQSDGPCGADIRIELLHDGQACLTIADSTADDGTHLWTCEPCSADTAAYRVRIKDLNSGRSDRSSAEFIISESRGATLLLDPAMDIDRTVLGDILPILWHSSDIQGDHVRIELLCSGTVCDTIAASVDNIGSFSWVVVASGADSCGYTIRITDLVTGALNESTKPFCILTVPPPITVTSPNGGELWAEKSQYDITWDHSAATGDSAGIELLHGGEVCLTITATTDNDGSFPWTAVACGVDSAGYTVRVTDLTTGYADESDSTFTLSPTPSSLTVAYPTGGEQWHAGSSYAVLWSHEGAAGEEVTIELLRGSSLISTISWGTENDGSFLWTAMALAGDPCAYTIRITDPTNGVSGESDSTFCIIPTPTTLSVTYPNGGEEWEAGSAHDILWSHTGAVGDSVVIELLCNSVLCDTIVAATLNDGRLTWVAAVCSNDSLACDSCSYTVRITDPATGATDASDAAFCILPTPNSLNITYPNGGESWNEGSAYDILWSHTGTAGDSVKIELLRNSTVCDIIAASTANYGTLSWNAVPCGSDSAGADSCNYRIRITDLATGISDQSDATFCIHTQLTVTVSDPNGGEQWLEGYPQQITWSYSASTGDSVRIEVLCNGTVSDTIALATLNDGSHSWTAARSCSDSCGYQVRITDLTCTAVDESDGTFCILPPALIILSPNGGEAWRDGISQSITWTSTGTAGDSVKLLLLRNGTMCDTIASSAANSGSYSWTPGRCGTDSSGYQVRITDLTTAASDESDAAFTIPPPILTVSDPDGGEQWVTGTAYGITWNVLGSAGDSVKIELLQEEEICVTIAASAANSGSFWWTAARCGSDSCGYRVRVTDLTTGISDQSDNSFSILAALTVTAPNGGEIWNEGTACEISWSHTGLTGESVSIELLRHGSVCDTITSSTDPDGSFSWLATPCAGDSSGYTIRITDNGIGATDASDSTFSIIPTPSSLSLTYPNGGELWIEENSYAIIWTHAGVAGSTVLIELLRDGSACDTIAASAANSGNLPWTAARCGTDSTGYRVRITDPTAGVSDTSDTAFSISPHPSSLTVTYPNGGETWDEGTSYAITWMHVGSAGDSVSIELLRSGTVCDTIASHAANSGSYPWSAALCGTDSSGYTVRVTDLATAASDVSNATFIISPTPSSLTVIYPNGGEILVSGSTYGLSWTHAGPAGDHVKVELLRAGSLCATISSSTPMGQTFPWVAAPCAGDSCGYAIRVTDLTTSAMDTSDASFCIPAPLALISPNGGEQWASGSTCTIVWHTAGPAGDYVSIDLMLAASTNTAITASTANDGSHSWTAQQRGGEEDGYKILISDLTYAFADSSNATFSIPTSVGMATPLISRDR